MQAPNCTTGYYIVASVPVLSIVWKKSLNANKLVAVDGIVWTQRRQAQTRPITASCKEWRWTCLVGFALLSLWLAIVETCPWLAACSHFRLFGREARSRLRGLVALVEVALSELLGGFSPQNNLLVSKIKQVNTSTLNCIYIFMEKRIIAPQQRSELVNMCKTDCLGLMLLDNENQLKTLIQKYKKKFHLLLEVPPVLFIH